MTSQLFSLAKTNMYDQYNTEIPEDKKDTYAEWISKNSKIVGRDLDLDKQNYDIQGLFMSGFNYNNPNEHGSSRFKKPNHITFSTDSQYSTKNTKQEWRKGSDDTWFYHADGESSNFTEAELKEYFNKKEKNSALIWNDKKGS